MTEQEKEELGLQFDKDDEEWSFDEMVDYLKGEFERHPAGGNGRANAVDKILARCARSSNLSSLEESRLMQYIVDVSRIPGLRAPMLKKQITELRSSGIQGTDHSEIAKAVLEDLEQLHPVRRYGSGLWCYKGSHWEELQAEAVMARIANDYGHLQAGKRHSDHKGIYSSGSRHRDPDMQICRFMVISDVPINDFGQVVRDIDGDWILGQEPDGLSTLLLIVECVQGPGQ